MTCDRFALRSDVDSVFNQIRGSSCGVFADSCTVGALSHAGGADSLLQKPKREGIAQEAPAAAPEHPRQAEAMALNPQVIAAQQQQQQQHLTPDQAQRVNRGLALRLKYETICADFVRKGLYLLSKLEPTAANFVQLEKLKQLTKQGQNAVIYMDKCARGHVPSAGSLQSLQETVHRIARAHEALKKGREAMLGREAAAAEMQQAIAMDVQGAIAAPISTSSEATLPLSLTFAHDNIDSDDFLLFSEYDIADLEPIPLPDAAAMAHAQSFCENDQHRTKDAGFEGIHAAKRQKTEISPLALMSGV